MPKGLSIHLGLNAVDPAHYGGWTGDLAACERDAMDMRRLAAAAGFKTKIMLTAQATSAVLFAALRSAAGKLVSGDILLLTNSSHGGQIPDPTGEEDDGQDETMCLYDRQVIDDELYAAFGRFADGVRILFVSDSCHSGTLARMVPPPGVAAAARSDMPAARFAPPRVTHATYAAHRALYAAIQDATAGVRPADVRASVLLISGCQDEEFSYDGNPNGAFTGALLKVWKRGGFAGDYAEFHQAIKAGLQQQHPNLFTTGAANPGFLKEKPFKI
jgi:hypothetical protein